MTYVVTPYAFNFYQNTGQNDAYVTQNTINGAWQETEGLIYYLAMII